MADDDFDFGAAPPRKPTGTYKPRRHSPSGPDAVLRWVVSVVTFLGTLLLLWSIRGCR